LPAAFGVARLAMMSLVPLWCPESEVRSTLQRPQ
jgi:hypothetical protein